MPIFEYRCTSCAEIQEVIVLVGEHPPSACSACGGPLERLWSRVGVRLIGWGFARNDALLADGRRRKPYHEIRDKAAELFD